MIYNRITVTFGVFNQITGPTISYQYDAYQILMIQGIALPEYYEVDFCNEGDSTTTTMVGTADGVLIPNKYLRTGKKVKAYIVIQGQDQGAIETRYEITLPVRIRPAREDIDPTPAEQQQIDELVELLNNAVVMAMPTGGDEGQVLAKKSNDDYDTEWVDQSGGGGGTTNYNSLSNKPQIEGVTLTGNVSASTLGLAKASDIPTVPVQSVNSKTGAVVLNASDVGALPSSTVIPTKTSDLVNDSGYITSAPVTSVNNKTGAVTLAASDVGATTIDLGITGASAGNYAKVKTVDANGKPTSWEYGSGGGGGGTSDYTDLSNKPSIEGVTLAGNKSASDLGLAKASDIPSVPVQSVNGKTGAVVLSASDVGAGTYSKPSGGIPKTDLASAVQTSLGKADTALQTAPVTSVNNKTGAVTLSASDVGAGTYSKPSTGIPSTDLASAVQTSLGKADDAIPAPSSPATGAFLVYNGSAWVAQTLSTWQGGNY